MTKEALRVTQQPKPDLGPIRGHELKARTTPKGQEVATVAALPLAGEIVGLRTSEPISLDKLVVTKSLATKDRRPEAKSTSDYTNWEKPKCCGN